MLAAVVAVVAFIDVIDVIAVVACIDAQGPQVSKRRGPLIVVDCC